MSAQGEGRVSAQRRRAGCRRITAGLARCRRELGSVKEKALEARCRRRLEDRTVLRNRRRAGQGAGAPGKQKRVEAPVISARGHGPPTPLPGENKNPPFFAPRQDLTLDPIQDPPLEART